MTTEAYVVFSGGNAPVTQGESITTGYLNSVEVMSYSWGTQNAVNLNHTKANPTPLAFTFTKRVDAASVPLWRALLNSSYYSTITISFLKQVSVSTDASYLTYTLTNVGVSSLRHFFSAGDDVPTEEVVLVYSGAKLAYAKQNPDGSLQNPFNYGWNYVTNLPM